MYIYQWSVQLFIRISLEESAKKIEKLYSNELLRPQVQINLVSSRSIQMSILGEVAKQGIYKINVDPTNKGNFSRVTDAIKKPVELLRMRI